MDWSARERVSRFREFVELVNLLLRHEITDYDGRFYQCQGAETIPAARFDDLCVDVGRDPSTIRHSLVCFPPLTPWQSVEYFRDMVGRFAEIGIDEFVLYWPQTWRDAPSEQTVFEQVGGTVMASCGPQVRRKPTLPAVQLIASSVVIAKHPRRRDLYHFAGQMCGRDDADSRP